MRYYVIAAIVLATACSPRETATRNTSDLDDYFANEFPANEPGASVLILKGNDTLFSGSYGLANLDTKEPITSKTLFNLGSISKTFVGNAILMLQEQGKLSVDDPLSKFFPGFKNKNISNQVTIRHLLTHTSGLPDNRQVSNDTVFYLTAKDAENWYPVTQADSLNFSPGSQWQYSNPAFNGLALIIEQVSGMKWQKFIEDQIMKPSGMMTSTITDGPHPASGVSHGYVKNHGEYIEDDYGEEPTFPASGNGGVWSSVEELALYEQALRNAAFLKAAMIQDSRTIKTFDNWSAPEKPFMGWSWFVTEMDSVNIIGHTGSQGGFYANYQVIPEKNILYIMLCNQPVDREGYQRKVFDWLKENDWFESDL
jgi:CubicO group peptidase (beta-lactamase class C family)